MRVQGSFDCACGFIRRIRMTSLRITRLVVDLAERKAPTDYFADDLSILGARPTRTIRRTLPFGSLLY